MGIGEPLLNYQNVTKAISIMHAEWGLGIGFHKITLSTAGVVDKIYKLIEDRITPNLAISLHAPNDGLRARLVPHIRKWSINDLINAARLYKKETKKDVTFEYVLLEGLNSDPSHAALLNRLVKNTGIKLNLIPYNPVLSLPYKAPSPSTINRFRSGLDFATVRRPRGQDIDSACGQLRIKEEQHVH
jgi:23S rRNA (adenine2503-C2)-methyltransferase